MQSATKTLPALAIVLTFVALACSADPNSPSPDDDPAAGSDGVETTSQRSDKGADDGAGGSCLDCGPSSGGASSGGASSGGSTGVEGGGSAGTVGAGGGTGTTVEEPIVLPVIPCDACALWSDPETWGGNVPGDGQDVTIPSDARVVLDEDTAALGGLTIEGELIFARKDLSLTADWVLVRGTLAIGSVEYPHTHRATITLTGADPNEDVMGMGTRGLMVSGGALHLHGAAPVAPWVRLDDHASEGATHLTLAAPDGWDAGDRVAVAPTDFYGIGQTEDFGITAVSGDGVDIDAPLAAARFGRLQYATTGGMSETPEDRIVPPAEPTPTVLDERAEVALLSRNIVVQGLDDATWQNNGFGAHVMIMGPDSSVQLVGVEVRRAGQRGHLGRYPIHWHRISYMESGQEAGDVDSHVVRDSVVWQSAHRCMVIHATNGVTLEDNVCYDIEGHAIFLEDAVERRNTITGNVVLRVRNPESPLKVHEGPVFLGGSSGFWLTNPDNVVSGNVAADAEGVGFWLAYPRRPTGPSANVPLYPHVMSFGEFDDNVAHSNQRLGLNLDFAPKDEAGNVEAISYEPTTGMLENSPDSWERFSIHRFTTYKHLSGGMWNRVIWPDYVEFVSADNAGMYFAGAGRDGLITRSLLVGHSMNSASNPKPDKPPVAFASYHSTYDMTQNVIVEFPFVEGLPSGTFGTNDYYIRAVDKGLVRSGDNLLVNSHPGFRSPPESPDFTFAGALWDPHGYFGPAGRYWTYDDPFLTAGAVCDAVAPAGKNGMSCEGPYYGVSGFVLNQQNQSSNARMTIDVTRQDASGATLGTWYVENGDFAAKLGNMRHFAARKGSRYLLRFPDGAAPNDVGMRVENAPSAEDTFLLGVHFTGGKDAQVYATTVENYFESHVVSLGAGDHKEIYSAVGDLATVAAADGGAFFQDKNNQIVWVKVRGGLTDAYVQSTDPHTDERLYEAMYLRVY